MPPVSTNKEEHYFLGCDPGWSGSFVLIKTGSIYLGEVDGNGTEIELLIRLRSLMNHTSVGKVHGVIEKVNGFMGNAGSTGASGFKFGTSFGRNLMALAALNIPFQEVAPQTWQKRMGIPPKQRKTKGQSGEKSEKFKKRLQGIAQRLYPTVDVSLRNADALLIAEYALRNFEGRLIT